MLEGEWGRFNYFGLQAFQPASLRHNYDKLLPNILLDRDPAWEIPLKNWYDVARDWATPYLFIIVKSAAINSSRVLKFLTAGGSTLMWCSTSKTVCLKRSLTG